MPADRLLGTLLRSLQTYTDQQDTPRLLGTASSLLTTLKNPLNVTLLTSQLLSAPAIWANVEDLRVCMRCLSVFHSAAEALVQHGNALRDKTADREFSKLQLERTLPKDDWIRAAVSGTDEHSPRWRHVLVIAGLLLGFGPPEDENLSRSMRSTLENALITATNLALEDLLEDEELAQQTLTLVLNHCFPILSDFERSRLDYCSLLPVMMRAALHSSEGLRSGYFLGTIDVDVHPTPKSKLHWDEQSASHHLVQSMLSSPLISSLGPLSRLIGHTVEHVSDSGLVMAVLDDLETFSKTLLIQWRQNKLSGIDSSEEKLYLDEMTATVTNPSLWKLLQSTMFAAVIILRSAIGRVLGDASLANDQVAPGIGKQTLHILRNIYFITSRRGQTPFSQYRFVYLAALDILGAYPVQVQGFLQDIKPTALGTVPQHPLDRCLDLYFLNTAEHYTFLLPTEMCNDLLVPAVTSYLAAGGSVQLLPIFEAAHSVTLAVFSAPQNVDLTLQHLPFYVDALLRLFPKNLSARQFRFAFKTLLQLASPPSLVAVSQPTMPSILMELLRERAENSSVTPIPPDPQSPEAALEVPIPLSEQATVILAILDTLTQIPSDLLIEWLPVAANMVNNIADMWMREHCKDHFWQVLVGGELDPERSRVCQAWWSTGGGRDLVLYGQGEDVEETMSGAIADDQSSKL